MALALLSHVVADLTLGKPALPWLSSTACVREALAALKHLGDDVAEISIWDCSDKSFSSDLAVSRALSSIAGKPSSCAPVAAHHSCLCIGKICMQNIICYLASEKCLCNLPDALDAPVSTLLDLRPTKCTVQHIDPDASLLEALDLLIGGAQNLVVPITRKASFKRRYGKPGMTLKTRSSTVPSNVCLPKDHDGQEYCWLTQEDVLRFLLGSISVFSPLPMMSIEALGLIRDDVRMVQVEQDASSTVELIKEACHDLSAVAIVDASEGISGAVHLVGDISCSTLQTCNETAALALTALSAGDFLVFSQDCRNPPQFLVDMIRTRVQGKLGVAKQPQPPLSEKEDANLLLQKLEMSDESSSEDDESGADSPIGPHDLSRKWHSTHFRSSRKGFTLKSRSGPIFCNPKSSLIAVLLQALAHREHYVWVTNEEDDSLMGIVTFKDILTVMLSHINVFS